MGNGETCSVLQYLKYNEPLSQTTLELKNGKNVVLGKLLNSTFKKLSEEDLSMLAEILSDKAKLLRSYLHTDFDAVKNLVRCLQFIF